jgi:hypothetical protein
VKLRHRHILQLSQSSDLTFHTKDFHREVAFQCKPHKFFEIQDVSCSRVPPSRVNTFARTRDGRKSYDRGRDIRNEEDAVR